LPGRGKVYLREISVVEEILTKIDFFISLDRKNFSGYTCKRLSIARGKDA
jgi:hypothetical protein